MDYGMIGKIEKAKWYAAEPERITFRSLTIDFKGDNNNYVVTLGPDGWDCTCPGFRAHGICPHVMSIEKMFKPMLKRSPLPYAPGQNVVSDVEKAYRYAEEPDRIHVTAFDVAFHGDNDEHYTSFSDTVFHCNCSFFATRGVCSHTMAMERVLKGMITTASPQVE
ncbi:MAG: SWIM zinc finger family protein [Anaerolinea sp.]|nr:SWIM zinc finger family protein [Anaerolinea sp.]